MERGSGSSSAHPKDWTINVSDDSSTAAESSLSEQNENHNTTSTVSAEPSSPPDQNTNRNDTLIGSAESSSRQVRNRSEIYTSNGNVNRNDTLTEPAESLSSQVQNASRIHTSTRNVTPNDTLTDLAEPSSSQVQNASQNDTPSDPRWRPSLDLLPGSGGGENRENEDLPSRLRQIKKNHNLCLRLRKYALEGRVDEAKSYFRQNSSRLRAAITDGYETVLHLAVGAKQDLLVEEMIRLIQELYPNNQQEWHSILRLQNKLGNTAFSYAVMAGRRSVAETMLRMDRLLLEIRGGRKTTPLHHAALFGQRDVATFLYHEIRLLPAEEQGNILTVDDKKAILLSSIDTTLYDLAKNLLTDNENDKLAMAYWFDEKQPPSQITPLHLLARTPLHLLDNNEKSEQTSLLTEALELVEMLWYKILEHLEGKVKGYFIQHSGLLFDAAHLGNFKFLDKLIGLYPDLVNHLDENERSIFHIAIMHRHTDLFKLIYKIGFDEQLIATYLDNDGNSLLHLAAIYPTQKPVSMMADGALEMQKYPDQRPVSKMPGAALEMQQELITFKEVASIVTPSCRVKKNKDGKTAGELFTITHSDLLKRGEEWMRQTATSCMIVATLIATVIFAAAFTVPGGSDKGIPIHLPKAMFRMFAFADAIALSSSSISIVIFWSILTSRYEEQDFLWKLPLKLFFGLLSLLISTATMMLAFSASFYLDYDKDRLNPIPVLITIFIFVPVVLYVFLQLGLLIEILPPSFVICFAKVKRKVKFNYGCTLI